MSTSEPSIAFIICSERGELEKRSLLFVKSLRKFGGKLSDSPIYSLAPRKGKNISKSTKEAFHKLNVIHQYQDLNQKYKDYNFANKIATCTYYEEQLTEDVLIFCDSDQLVLGDLNELIFTMEDVAMQHVAIKGIGTNGKDENANYWKQLYDLCQVKEQRLITLDDNQQIFQYFNAGLIAVKRDIGLFKLWSHNFDLIMENRLEPSKGNFFIEQSVLSATISSMKLSVKKLPTGYNFHLLKHTKLNETMVKIDNGEIKMLHYHTAFDNGNSIKIPENLSLLDSIILNWLNRELIDLGISKKPFITRLETELLQHHKKIKDAFNDQKGKK